MSAEYDAELLIIADRLREHLDAFERTVQDTDVSEVDRLNGEVRRQQLLITSLQWYLTNIGWAWPVARMREALEEIAVADGEKVLDEHETRERARHALKQGEDWLKLTQTEMRGRAGIIPESEIAE